MFSGKGGPPSSSSPPTARDSPASEMQGAGGAAGNAPAAKAMRKNTDGFAKATGGDSKKKAKGRRNMSISIHSMFSWKSEVKVGKYSPSIFQRVLYPPLSFSHSAFALLYTSMASIAVYTVVPLIRSGFTKM